MQPAVAAAEIEQGVEADVKARLHHASDEDVMIAAVVHRVALAFEHAQRFGEDRGAALPA